MALMTNPERKLCARHIKPEAPRTRLHDDSHGLSYRAAAAEISPPTVAAMPSTMSLVAAFSLTGAAQTPDARKGGLNGLSANRARHAGDLMRVADGRGARARPRRQRAAQARR